MLHWIDNDRAAHLEGLASGLLRGRVALARSRAFPHAAYATNLGLHVLQHRLCLA